jgi:hypothetical protein
VTNAVLCLARNRRNPKRPSEPRGGVHLEESEVEEEARFRRIREQERPWLMILHESYAPSETGTE